MLCYVLENGFYTVLYILVFKMGFIQNNVLFCLKNRFYMKKKMFYYVLKMFLFFFSFFFFFQNNILSCLRFLRGFWYIDIKRKTENK